MGKDFQQKDGTGALFKTKEKRTEDSPDYFGNCKVGGKEYQIGAWIKTAKSGKKYMSLAIQTPRASNSHAPSGEGDTHSDDCPF